MALTKEVADWKVKIQAALDAQGTALTGMKTALDSVVNDSLPNILSDQQTLLQKIVELQNTATGLSTEDKAALADILDQAQGMVDKTSGIVTEATKAQTDAKALADQVPDAPPAPQA